MASQWYDGYYYYDMLPLYYNGSPLGLEVTPGNFDWVVGQQIEQNPALNYDLFGLTIIDVKAYKEIEFRNLADEWYRKNVRTFEGEVIALKRAAGTALNATETATRDKILANYNALSTSITTLRSSGADWRGIIAMQWTPPNV